MIEAMSGNLLQANTARFSECNAEGGMRYGSRRSAGGSGNRRARVQ
jgi:hypothetical protein